MVVHISPQYSQICRDAGLITELLCGPITGLENSIRILTQLAPRLLQRLILYVQAANKGQHQTH